MSISRSENTMKKVKVQCLLDTMTLTATAHGLDMKVPSERESIPIDLFSFSTT